MATVRATMAGLVLLLAVGCSSIPSFNVTVQLDAEHIKAVGTIPTIEVNLVGVNEAEVPQWQNYSIDSYWKPDDALRQGADKFVFHFGETKALAQKLDEDDPVWELWADKTAKHIYVIADIPGLGAGGGKGDGRLLVLPLDPGAWPGDTFVITVKPGGMTVTPSPETKE